MKGVKNLVADHLSRIERRTDPLPIRDDFLDKDFVVTRLFASVSQTTRSSRYSSSITRHLEAAITNPIEQPKKYWTVGFIGLPSSGMPITSSPPKSNVKELEWPSIEDMRCPSNPFFFAKSLMFGVLTSWVHFLSPTAKATKTNDAKVVVDFVRSNIFCRFSVSKAIISDQGSHFCNRTMSTLLEKYGTNGQVEVFNREIKQILQKMANPNRNDWSQLLEDAFGAHKTAY
ncbi:hypothetical protein CR513_28578, partial [Mucuna pruriens]